MTPTDAVLTVLLVAAVVVIGWRKARRGDQRKARRSSYRGRIDQARRESPADLVLAAAAFLAAEMRLVPEKAAWPVANEISTDLAVAADAVAAHAPKGGWR